MTSAAGLRAARRARRSSSAGDLPRGSPREHRGAARRACSYPWSRSAVTTLDRSATVCRSGRATRCSARPARQRRESPGSGWSAGAPAGGRRSRAGRSRRGAKGARPRPRTLAPWAAAGEERSHSSITGPDISQPRRPEAIADCLVERRFQRGPVARSIGVGVELVRDARAVERRLEHERPGVARSTRHAGRRRDEELMHIPRMERARPRSPWNVGRGRHSRRSAAAVPG